MRAPIFALMLALAAVTGCAKANPALVAAEDAVHDGLAKADDEIRRVCQAPALAAPCADVRPLLSDALGAAIAFNRAIAAQKPTALAPLLSSVGALANKVAALPSSETAGILVELARAIAAASARVGGVQ